VALQIIEIAYGKNMVWFYFILLSADSFLWFISFFSFIFVRLFCLFVFWIE
jgi:hypothetical protein